MTQRRFVSLHGHTSFSAQDGVGMPSGHVARVAALDMEAVAFTEHGNVSSHSQAEKAARKAGIKPLFGMEAYCAVPGEPSRFKNHLTLLAQDTSGYQNLMRLTTEAWRDFYFEPTVTGDNFLSNNAGLIVLSGCSGSKLACDLLGGKGTPEHFGSPDYAKARKTASKFKEILGDRYYLEVQPFDTLDRTRAMNTNYERLSQDLGIPLVVTGDVHYAAPSESDLQVLVHAAGRGNNTFEKQQQSWGYDVRLSYPESDMALVEALVRSGMSRRAAMQALDNTALIASRCDVTLPKAEMFKYPTEDEVTLIWSWLREGWKYRWPRSPNMRANKQEYLDKVNYEMELIVSKDFTSYFLMLSDVVRWAKERGITVGPARGSAASSVVCWLLRITEIEPPLFKMMAFERFIDVTRADLPDVDLDFEDGRRDEIRLYLQDKYGVDCVGNVGNFVRYKGKSALDDVQRVHRLTVPKADVEVVKKLVLERSGGDSRAGASLEDTFDMFPVAKAVLDKHPVLNDAIRLEGDIKTMSVHAGGLIVSSRPLSEVTAMYQRVDGKGRVLQVLAVDKYDAEYLNLMKADFLGLTTMGIIADVLKEVGLSLEDLYSIPLDDQETLDVFKRNDVIGVFQFEGRATRLVNADVSPDNFLELVDVNALSRPGPLFSGATAAYCDTKFGRISQMKFHPAVDQFTNNTRGQIVYQEQILRILREVGGFAWGDTHDVRRIISKKLGEAAFNNYLDRFIDGAKTRHNMDRDLAEVIWKQLATSGTYAFVYAHSVSYTLIGFWCAWLKAHYPENFYASALRRAGDEDVLRRLIKDATKHGVKVCGPTLQSGVSWSSRPGEVNAGLTQIKGIGEKTAQAIAAYREEHGDFEDWGGLGAVRGIGPKTVESIREFAESADPFEIQKTGRILSSVRASLRSGALGPLPRPNIASSDDVAAHRGRAVWVGMVKFKEYKDYIENQRSRYGLEHDEIIAKMRHPDKVKWCSLHAYDEGDEDVYIRFDRIRAFPRHQKALETLEVGRDVVLIEGKVSEGFGSVITAERMWVIDPTED